MIDIAFDGGRGGEAALIWATEFWADGPVEVVTVEDSDELGVRIPAGPTASEVSAAAGGWLLNNAPRLDATFAIEQGEIVDVLRRRSGHAELTVLGSHRGGTDGGRLEPVPRKVAAASDGPVVVVPASNPVPGGPVIVGVAEDEASTGAIEFAARLAARWRRPLRILHAWWLVPHLDDGDGFADQGQARDEHQQVVDAAVAVARRNHPELPVEGEAVVGETIAVLSAACADCCLMVIGRRRTGVLAGWLLDTVGHELLNRLPCPIGVVPTSSTSAEDAPA